ncbi:MAG TPA: type II toxin-antitoxin system VapC family toxin [Terriglobales bacterium]|nr:type II toxin-antitoxin system VapC family toxin [Terriglobales bacterium]
MVIDSSALVAIFLAEPERSVYLELIEKTEVRLISAVNVFETGMVLEARRGEAIGREFDLFVTRANLQIVPFDADQVVIARQAFRRFGKGRHRAALSFGDCFSYALAKLSGEPLLAKGNNFAQTDIALCSLGT